MVERFFADKLLSNCTCPRWLGRGEGSNEKSYICIYIYSLKESEDGQLLTIKKLKNLIKNIKYKNVSVLDLHQLHEKLNLTDLPK